MREIIDELREALAKEDSPSGSPSLCEKAQIKLRAYHAARELERQQLTRLDSFPPEARSPEMYQDWGRAAMAADRAWNDYKVAYNCWIDCGGWKQ